MSALAEALVTARRARDLSQEELAELAGLTQAAVSRYESGSRVPQREPLCAIARALGVTPEFLEGVGKIRGAWAVDAHMRRRKTAPATVWRRLEARLNMLRNHARYLYEDIGVNASNVVPSFDPIFTEPEEAARMTRMQWRIPTGPVRSLVGWLESAGCLIVEEDFSTQRVDGLSQWVDDVPLILLNSEMPTDRKRQTLAHELGHLCLHTQDIGDDPEHEAERFAAEFLMPAEVIRPQLRNFTAGHLLDLKRAWGVSVEALIERAYHLRVLPAGRRTALYKQLSARGWRRQEPASDELAPEVPHLAVTIGAALAERGLDDADIARLAGFSGASADNPFVPPVVPRLRVV